MVLISPTSCAKPLHHGDEVVSVAASSFIDDEKLLLEGLKILEKWGLVCRPQNLNTRQWGYLAGNDETRLKDLHQDKPASLMAFARGGWGAARLLEHSPTWQEGWLLGYSDVTSLHLARLSAGFDGCVHGPLLTSLAKEPEWSQIRLHDLLFGKQVPDIYGEPWVKGVAKGPLVVANLTVSSHLLGSSYMPDLKGAILIFEDIGEAPYRIDRMLTQWRLAGLLQGLAGLGFGNFTDCEGIEENHSRKSFKLKEVLVERSRDLNIPIVGELPIGHCCGNASLPLGRKAILNANNGSLSLLISEK